MIAFVVTKVTEWPAEIVFVRKRMSYQLYCRLEHDSSEGYCNLTDNVLNISRDSDTQHFANYILIVVDQAQIWDSLLLLHHKPDHRAVQPSGLDVSMFVCGENSPAIIRRRGQSLMNCFSCKHYRPSSISVYQPYSFHHPSTSHHLISGAAVEATGDRLQVEVVGLSSSQSDRLLSPSLIILITV